VGDVFDFWFEYKEVVPKGYIRFLAKIAEFTDHQIPVHFFTGNHDMWLFDYLQTELGIIVHTEPYRLQIQNQEIFLAHGDGLGPGDHGYKFLKKVFRLGINQWLFARLHPNLGIKIMKFFSQRKGQLDIKDATYQGPEKEWLIQYCEEELKNREYDFFIMGHRHLVVDYTLGNGKSRYINLGDMITYNSYAILKNGKLSIQAFENSNLPIDGN